jgi:tetratricopeptide (TPR) repeat protein
MDVKGWSHIEPSALRDIAGEKVFVRGEAYFQDGLVDILALEPESVLAQVAGTEEYRTVLTVRGGQIGGECTCPAFADRGFCKHLVATALAANAAKADGTAEGIGPSGRIRDYLRGKGLDALIEMIVDLAEQDPDLLRRLDMAAASVYADDSELERRLRTALDSATRTRSFIDYRAARGWAAGVNSVLETIGDLASGARAAVAFGLAERAIERIEHAIGSIDDSDGHCGALLSRAVDIHVTAAREVRPEPVQFARRLFQREMESDYGVFDEAVALYADILGEEGLAEYRRLAREAWEKLPALQGKDPRHRESSIDHNRLRSILDFFAERDGDVDTRIALLAKDLSSPWAYLRTAELCVAEHREAEALRWAEEGLWMFDGDPPDERLVVLTVSLLSKMGRDDDAKAHLWRAFEKAPSLKLYARLRDLGGEDAHDRAVKFLENRSSQGRGTAWYNPGDLLIRILMQEKAFGAAWAAVHRKGASLEVKEALARASEGTHPQDALAAYGERVDYLANVGGDQAYAQAVALIGHMATLQNAAEQATYVATFKERFGRKRNLMKLLA